jgi:hypothetical protein
MRGVLRRRTFPGVCFLAGAPLEMGTRPGPVKEAVADFQDGFVDLLRGFAATAIEQNQLPSGEDPDQLAFELNGICLAADANFVLHDNPAVLDLARQVQDGVAWASAPTATPTDSSAATTGPPSRPPPASPDPCKPAHRRRTRATRAESAGIRADAPRLGLLAVRASRGLPSSEIEGS